MVLVLFWRAIFAGGGTGLAELVFGGAADTGIGVRSVLFFEVVEQLVRSNAATGKL